MKIQRIVIVAIVSVFTASLAHAQYYWGGPPGSGPGPYFRMGVGPTFFQDGQLKGFAFGRFGTTPGFNGPTGRVSYDVGVSGEFGFGYAFNQYVSLGFDTGYTWAQFSSVQNYFVNNSSLGNLPFLANITVSMPIPHSNVVPYIGGGIGGADSILHADHFVEPFSGNFIDGSESDVVFAYQAMAGVRFMLNPNMSVGVAYEFFGTGNPTFSYPPSPNLDAEFQGVRTHSVLFTFQANF